MVIVGLGSNQGNSSRFLRQGAEALVPFACSGFAMSSLWRTTPVDCPPGSDDFMNAAIGFEPIDTLDPLTLLDELKAIERRFGRQAVPVKNAPRELDLDLLIYHDQIVCEGRLTVPHPRAHERRFVLEPVAEIAPELEWPGVNKTVAELLADLVRDQRCHQRSEERCERLGPLECSVAGGAR